MKAHKLEDFVDRGILDLSHGSVEAAEDFAKFETHACAMRTTIQSDMTSFHEYFTLGGNLRLTNKSTPVHKYMRCFTVD